MAPRIKIKIPNTRGSAALIAAGLALLGFGAGVVLLLYGPTPRPRPLNTSRLLAQVRATPQRDLRPELWQTPTPAAPIAFPSATALASVRGTSGFLSVRYSPRVGQTVLPLGSIRDAAGRAVVTIVATMVGDDDIKTPEPLRPVPVEPTQLTIVANSGASDAIVGCVLAMGAQDLRVIATLGTSNLGECQSGAIRLPAGGAVVFAVEYDRLPNYRSRDGAWREGAIFGRTEISAALTDSPPA